MREAFRRVQRALALNPDLSPFGPVPYGESRSAGAGTGVLPPPARDDAAVGQTLPPGNVPVEDSAAAFPPPVETPPGAGGVEEEQPRRKRRRPRLRRLSPDAVVHRVKMGEAGVTCALDHFGPDGVEAFSEGSTIYINVDHPLYQRNSHRKEAHTLHLGRLLTQEISMMKDPRSPRQAFERQSKLLRDAFAEDRHADRPAGR